MRTIIHQMINVVLFAFPRLIGCRKVVLNEIGADHMFQTLKSLNASLAWEFHTPCDELSNYTFRLEKRLIGLIVEEWEPVKLIAPDFIIEKIQAALPSSGKDNRGN